MKNVTLGQIQKLLSLLVGITAEQMQKALESGFLAEIIRTGELDSIKKTVAMEKVIYGWHMIFRVVKPEEIIITCPRSHCTYYSDNRKEKFQVKVWKTNHGLWKKNGGHVSDGGMKPKDAVLLLEYYSDTNFDGSNCPHIDSHQLCRVSELECEDWHKETIGGTDSYGRHQEMDIIRVRRK